MKLSDELKLAKELAIEAGTLLLTAFHRHSTVHWKGVDNPVTDADRSANALLVGALRECFPNDGILAEESLDDTDRLARSRVWIIDPMDGTKEFIAHIGEFAVMLGLAIDGKPALGVVYQPTEGKLFYATTQCGAFIQQRGLTMQLKLPSNPMAREIVAAISRSHDSVLYESIRRALGIERIVRSGSAGLKIGMICQQFADLYMHFGPETSQWDTCAPDIILHEAGGRITDMRNSPLLYNAPDPRNLRGIIATNGVIHERVVQAVNAILS